VIAGNPADTAVMDSARQAYERAAPGEHVIGWRVDADDRAALLTHFVPRYPRTVADHVTLRAGVAADAAPPPTTVGVIVGRSDDGRGVEALVVHMEGGTDRPDGSTYHITWSLAEGREAIESNDVIRTRGWVPVEPLVPVRLEGARFP